MKIKKYTKTQAEKDLGLTARYLSDARGENGKNRLQTIHLGATCLHFGITEDILRALGSMKDIKITQELIAKEAGVYEYRSLRVDNRENISEMKMKIIQCFHLGAIAKVVKIDSQEKIEGLCNLVEHKIIRQIEED